MTDNSKVAERNVATCEEVGLRRIIHLRCIHPVGPYKRGDTVTDPQEIAHLLDKHGKRFVRVPACARQ